FEGWVLLNDFQNLALSAQRQIARDLKYVAETSRVRFLVIGSWAGSARFLELNEDISAYVAQVFVPPWSVDDLQAIMDAAEPLLNGTLSKPLKEFCAHQAAGCARNLHEICDALFRRAGILGTAIENTTLDDLKLAQQAVDDVYRRPFLKYRRLI